MPDGEVTSALCVLTEAGTGPDPGMKKKCHCRMTNSGPKLVQTINSAWYIGLCSFLRLEPICSTN